MRDLIFVHGMFQNPRSWEPWAAYFAARGYFCSTPAWPFHDGDPRALREAPPAGLGTLGLSDVITTIEGVAARHAGATMIGHSVGGLVAQVLLSRGAIARGVAISSVAPNRMLDFDWGFLKNSAVITNPLKGDDPVFMDAKTFHQSFANTLSEADAAAAYDATATHDSRNVLRDCMGDLGKIDMDAPHRPLLLIGGEMDQIVPAHLSAKNFRAYRDRGSVTAYKEFAGRSHYICGEPGWEDLAAFIADWLDRTPA